MATDEAWSAADLDALAAHDVDEARRYAARAVVLARMLAAASAKKQGWRGRAPWAGLVIEVAGTCKVSQRSAESLLADADHLVNRLPATHTALENGSLRVKHALALINVTETCTPDLCAAVEAAVLPLCAHDTPAELRRRAEREVLRADPVAAQERHDEATQDRSTWVKPAPDGMALQGAYLTAVQGRRFDADLTALFGRSLFRDGDPRTDAQRRADLLADLPGLALELLDRSNGVLPPIGIPSIVDRYLPDTPAPAGNRVSRRRRRRTTVLVQVPSCTSVGLSSEPVWLDGYGWITPGQGLVLLPEAELRKACVDADTGRLLALEDPVVPGVRGDAAPAGGTARERATAWWQMQQAAAAVAAGRLRDALDGAGLTVDDLPDPGAAGVDRRRTARPAPPEARDLAAAVHRALLGMATGTTVVLPDDPALRTEPDHDPSEAVREYVDLRDGGCDGIGCHTPATVNDLDHEDAWPAGPTTAAQLRNRSRRCHGAKHHGWKVEVDAAGWSTWTSPGGRRYRRPPRHAPPPPPPPPGRRPRPVMRTGRRDGAGDGDEPSPASGAA